MDNGTYLLTIKIPFTDMDDIDARKTAKVVIDGMNLGDVGSVKLQQVFKDKEPRKIEL